MSLTVLLAGLAWCSLRVVNHDPSPALGDERQRSVVVRSTARRAVLVVVDGLREDVSRELPYLNELRARGADGVARAPFPSLSRPSYATLASGVPPWRSGVRNNAFGARRVAVDTIFDRARDRGLHVGGGGNWSWWDENFGDRFDAWRRYDGDVAAFERGAREALALPTQLVVLHAVDCDQIAHREGVSPAYHLAAREIDAALARVFSVLDLRRDVVVVTSDHGHLSRGGHGGPEPEVTRVPMVLAGFGIRPGKGLELGDAGGIAATLAVLLGLETPRHAEATSFDSALDHEQLGVDIVAARVERVERGRTPEESKASALAPIGASALGLALLALLGWRCTRRSDGAESGPVTSADFLATLGAVLPGVIALAVAVTACVGVLWALGMPASYSAIVSHEQFTLELTLGAAVGALVHALVLGVVTSRLPSGRRDDAWRRHLTSSGVLCFAAAPVLWLVFGYSHPQRLPPPLWMFLPLPVAFVGGLWCGAAGLALLWFDARARRRARSSTGSGAATGSR